MATFLVFYAQLTLWITFQLAHTKATPGLVRILPEERTTGLGCIPEGRTVSYKCTVTDPTGPPPIGSTIWRGTAFQCPTTSNQINLPHSQFSTQVISTCGSMRAKAVKVEGTNFVSVLNVTATAELDGASISCYFSNTEIGDDILTIKALPPPPGPLTVNLSGSYLAVYWSPPSSSVRGGVGGYLFDVTGEDCGCVSMNISGNTTSVTCSGWIAAGQTCTFELRTISQDCGFTSDPVNTKKILKVTCDPAVLGENFTSANDSGTATTSNGIVIYTGIGIGSIAYLKCNDGYTSNADSKNRSCSSNGKWNGQPQICVSAQIQSLQQSSLASLSILLVILILVMFTVGVIVERFCTVKLSRPSRTALHILTFGGLKFGMLSRNKYVVKKEDTHPDHNKENVCCAEESDISEMYTGLNLEFTVKQEISTPTGMWRSIDAVVNNTTVYFRLHDLKTIYKFNSDSQEWSQLPDSPVHCTTLVILPDYTDGQNIIHTIGGYKTQDSKTANVELINKLYQYSTVNSSWIDSVYPPMKEMRREVTAVWESLYLIVAGGRGKNGPTKTVEILHLVNKQWSYAAQLPQPIFRASGCVSNFVLYIFGGRIYDKKKHNNLDLKTVYKASLHELISCKSKSKVFEKVSDAPFLRSAYTTFGDNIIAVGGTEDDPEHPLEKCVNYVYVYDSKKNSWKKMSATLGQARCCCFAVSILQPVKKLVVVGGHSSGLSEECVKCVEIGERKITSDTNI